jgi:Family of unknown function (DUF6314)
VTRLGWDGGAGPALRLRGTARCWPSPAGLAYAEHGIVTAGAYRGEASRRYLFRCLDTGAATVCFEDGRLFHHLDLADGIARVHHDCGPDRYDGRYRVLGPDCWTLSWRVTGPRKRQRITSRFVRLADPG